MKRALAVSLILALLASALSGVLVVKPGAAQSGSYPSPEIRVTSPRNNTEYSVDSVSLVFSVGSGTPSSFVTVRFSDVRCYLDGGLVEQFDEASLAGVSHLAGLSNGNHTVRVSAFVSGSVEVTPFYERYGFEAAMHLMELLHGTVIDSGNVVFAVNVPEPPPSEPFHSEPLLSGSVFWIAVIASAAVVSFGLMAYFLKRKRQGSV
jgi:hypothetical protein